MPSILVAIVPADSTVTNRASSGAHVTLVHIAVGIVLEVQLTPSLLVQQAPELFPTTTKIAKSGDQQTLKAMDVTVGTVCDDHVVPLALVITAKLFDAVYPTATNK